MAILDRLDGSYSWKNRLNAIDQKSESYLIHEREKFLEDPNPEQLNATRRDNGMKTPRRYKLESAWVLCAGRSITD